MLQGLRGSDPPVVGQEKFSNLREFPWRSIQRLQDRHSLRVCQGDDPGGEEQRLLKLSPERPFQERREITHNAIIKRDTIQHHAAPLSAVVVLLRSAR